MKDALLSSLAEELTVWKDKNDRLGQFKLSHVAGLTRQPRSWLSGWQKFWANEDEQLRAELDARRKELEAEVSRAIRENCRTEEYEASRKLKEHDQLTMRNSEALAISYQKEKRENETRLAWYEKCKNWMLIAAQERLEIESTFSKAWQKIQRMQGREFALISSHSESSDEESDDQVDGPDLNHHITIALATHVVPTSRADCPCSRDYGDDL
jgi:hypothetical protein